MLRRNYEEAKAEAITSPTLQIKSVTKGSNGYPMPFEGSFVFGFSNLEEAQTFAEKYKTMVATAHWRDGWDCCEIHNNTGCVGEYSPEDINLSDNYSIFHTLPQLKSEVYRVANEAAQDEESPSYLIAALKEEAEDTMEEVAHVDWAKESVVLYKGGYWDTVPKKAMSIYHDTHHYQIGVWLTVPHDNEALKELIETLREFADNEDIEGEVLIIPDGCEDKGFTQGNHDLATVLKFLSEML